MDIGFKTKLYSQLPAPTPQNDEKLLDVWAYLPIRPNHAGSVLYSDGLKGLQKVLNYAQVYRWSDVVRKVLSRQKSEQIRNDKWLVCGLGKSLDGTCYLFVHPFAQYYQSQIAVPKCWRESTDRIAHEKLPMWAQIDEKLSCSPPIEQVANQLPPRSGLSSPIPAGLFPAVAQLLDDYRAKLLPISQCFSADTASHRSSDGNGKQSNSGSSPAVLFGYGNYARTVTLPYMRPFVHLAKIHEIDPSLLIGASGRTVSTNPVADSDDSQYPVWLIAGFHHTHAGLALDAMRKGCVPVIEKPIATTLDECQSIADLVSTGKHPIYQCFQKRYQVFNQYTFADLGVQKGEPIHYKAIVFEIPLHSQHWYNWPVSGSRIVSNGSHWIDHFLFLNNYAQYVSFEARKIGPDELLLLIQLENGANAVITLSDIGANRIGMREFVELSVSGRRCTMTDSMHYMSESNRSIIRKAKTDKMHYLRLMYDSIGRSIAQGGGGDSAKSLLSTELTIKMDMQLREDANCPQKN
ncbi:MAG: hypothetical protein O2931_01805 [Planctomycetota bacterium]|nr:hypothetical protein [Planctomycetota bacterium]MDA1177508.1 hypothetical protein [Planctomycetota bacterium]